MPANRGEVWLVDLNPVIGHEQSGKRPALVISDDLFNHSPAELGIVIPITSKHKGIPTHIELETSFLTTRSYIKTEDIRSISTKRLVKRLGVVEANVMSLVEERIRYLLGLGGG